MTEDLRGQFFLVKGQFAKTYPVSVGDDTVYIGGYDPYDTNTKEWYQLVYRPLYTCVASGKDLEKVLQGGEHFIKTFKGQRKKVDLYFKRLGEEGHLHTSMSKVFSLVDDLWGDFFEDEVCDMEDHVYESVVGDNPLKRAQKLMKKSKVFRPEEDTPAPTPSQGVMVKPKVKLGVKKLAMS